MWIVSFCMVTCSNHNIYLPPSLYVERNAWNHAAAAPTVAGGGGAPAAAAEEAKEEEKKEEEKEERRFCFLNDRAGCGGVGYAAGLLLEVCARPRFAIELICSI